MHQPTYTFPPSTNNKVKILVNGKPISAIFNKARHINFIGDNIPEITENLELDSYDVLMPPACKCNCKENISKSKDK